MHTVKWYKDIQLIPLKANISGSPSILDQSTISLLRHGPASGEFPAFIYIINAR